MTSRQYRYLPLNDAQQQIRLMTLLPDDFTSPIRIVLTRTQLTPSVPSQSDLESFMKFEVLSYTWGSAETPASVFIGKKELAITENLAEALTYLRYEDKPRELWVDAICVNQKDLEERSRQLRQMTDIYARALGMLVWLGPETKDTRAAMKSIAAICRNFNADWKYDVMQRRGSPKSLANLTVNLFSMSQANPLLNFLKSPWFERLWSWVEIKLAPPGSRTVVKCGTHEFTWESVQTAVFCLEKNFKRFNPELASSIIYTRKLCTPQFTTFYEFEKLLTRQSHDPSLNAPMNTVDSRIAAECSDPRDRVFALMLLRSEEDYWEPTIGIEPDYTKSILDTYKDFFKKHTTGAKHVELLSFIDVSDDSIRIPSWLPDWSVQRSSMPIRGGFASGHSNCEVAFTEGDIMRVTGVSTGTIKAISRINLLRREMPGLDMALEIKRVALQLGISDWVNPGTCKCRTFTLTLLAKTLVATPQNIETHGRTMEFTADVPSAFARFENVLHKVFHSLQQSVEDEAVLSAFLSALVFDFCCQRSLFTTHDGNIGLGPGGAKVGDTIAVLLGCNRPVILRPNEDGNYQFIGECFCDPIMHAEAFLGKMPENFQYIMNEEQYSTGKKQFFDRWINHTTKALLIEDPRLGKIPKGWKRQDHREKRLYTKWMNTETNEKWEDLADPRLLPEVLRERGVDLKYFNLV